MNTPPPHRQVVLEPAAVDELLRDTTPWLSCEDCFERMDSYVEALRGDPGYLDEAMSTHLRGCAACDEEAQSLVALLAEGSD
jgi:hypothetical protein